MGTTPDRTQDESLKKFNSRDADRRQDSTGTPPAGHVVDRRVGLERRDIASGKATGLERHRGPGRRLSEFTKSAEEGEMNKEQFLFLMAIEAFKQANGRAFPTWTDVLEVMRLLGYRKTTASELSLNNAEDWTEAADAASNVRPDNWSSRGKAGTGFGAGNGKTEAELTDEAIAEFEAQFEGEDFDSEAEEAA